MVKLFTTQSRLLRTLKKNALENIEGKGEHPVKHIFLFPQYF